MSNLIHLTGGSKFYTACGLKRSGRRYGTNPRYTECENCKKTRRWQRKTEYKERVPV